jgi:hypothetical protein
MNMTTGKILSVPIYSTSGVIAMAGLFFIVPGGIFVLAALLLCWLADRLTSSRDSAPDYSTTIEEYEETMSGITTYGDISYDERDNQEKWEDFWGEDYNDKDDTT